jgi:hypothetical protein
MSKIDNLLETSLVAIRRSLSRSPNDRICYLALGLLHQGGRLSDTLKRQRVMDVLAEGTSAYTAEQRASFFKRIVKFGILSKEVEHYSGRYAVETLPAAHAVQSNLEPIDPATLPTICANIRTSLNKGQNTYLRQLDTLVRTGALNDRPTREAIVAAIVDGIGNKNGLSVVKDIRNIEVQLANEVMALTNVRAPVVPISRPEQANCRDRPTNG